MKLHTSLPLLAALGVLAAPAWAQVDTSKWTCSSCPYPKGTSASVELGLGHVSDDSAAYGDWRGLQKKGAHLVLGGSASQRSGDYYAEISASDLGLASRELAGEAGREGLYRLTLGYSSIPRHYVDGAVSPFQGLGGNTLTLPAGYPVAVSSQAPAASLVPIGIDSKWQRLDLAGTWLALPNITVSVGWRRDIRDGSKPLSSSFFATAAQMAAPLDQVTDQFEVAATYARGPIRASLAYQLSQFSNDAQAFTFANPFTPVLGATRGQLALAPDNQMHQLVGSGSYVLSPMVRFSGDFSVGRLTQDEAFLAATINPALAARVAALPAGSLDGQVDMFHGSLRAVATPLPSLRLSLQFVRDVRDNTTDVRRWPMVATDMFYSGQMRANTPFSTTQDRTKFAVDWRGPASLRVAAGVDVDERNRTYHEVSDIRETTAWARLAAQPHEAVSLSFKAASADRDGSTYGVATWFGVTENPLLRKYQLADRKRQSAGARIDLQLGEALSLGFSADHADDRYADSLIGLTAARTAAAGVDLAYAASETLRFTAYAQGERIRSRQAGSDLFRTPDWWARADDRFDVFGVGVRWAAIPDKLDLSADLNVSRAKSETSTDSALGQAAFPTDKSDLDSLRLSASYKLSDTITISGGYAYEKLASSRWQLDGIAPGTVSNVLGFGAGAPDYTVHVLRVAVRYRF